MTTTTIMIMAGGTGGHVFPALAVARRLREQGAQPVWLGTREGIEARVVPAAGFEIDFIRIRSVRGGGLLRWLLLPMRLNLAMVQALRILRRRRPAAVLAMGGFAAGPGGLMASLLHIPLVVHEQNAIAGLTNRWLARIADRVLAGFPGAFGERHGVRVTGNPVRPEILALPAPEQRLADRRGRLRLLVVGGSQGARVFNEIVPQALQSLPETARPEVWHQTGKHDEPRVSARYRACMHDARVTAFIDDMAAAYAWADLVICRAGAMTIAELAAAGLAAILVPLPQAADDHQSANARFLASRDAAVLLPQNEFSATRLAELLTEIGGNRALLARMAVQARACAVTDATDAVAQQCLEAAHA
jgi:UDP-N-acetylglucosamine--N-acetylmuramyl-(pentapeptide) pyrophosphoryl-undecaprenol N-acetylglucosamine transferase